MSEEPSDSDEQPEKKIEKKHVSKDDKVFGKDKSVSQLDPFFVEEANAQEHVQVEKRAVMRDGRVPKFQKNMEKLEQKRIEQQAIREGWLQKKEEERQEAARKVRNAKPLKINAGSYGTGITKLAVNTATYTQKTAKLNVKF